MSKTGNSSPLKSVNREDFSYFSHWRERIDKQGIVFDNAILAYYLVESYDRAHGTSCVSKLKLGRKPNFEILHWIISDSGAKIILTPHILTELSRIMKNEFKGELRKNMWSGFSELLRVRLVEYMIDKNNILTHRHLPEFGVTDTGIMLLKDHAQQEAKPPILVTIDGNLMSCCATNVYCEPLGIEDLEKLAGYIAQ